MMESVNSVASGRSLPPKLKTYSKQRVGGLLRKKRKMEDPPPEKNTPLKQLPGTPAIEPQDLRQALAVSPGRLLQQPNIETASQEPVLPQHAVLKTIDLSDIQRHSIRNYFKPTSTTVTANQPHASLCLPLKENLSSDSYEPTSIPASSPPSSLENLLPHLEKARKKRRLTTKPVPTQVIQSSQPINMLGRKNDFPSDYASSPVKAESPLARAARKDDKADSLAGRLAAAVGIAEVQNLRLNPPQPVYTQTTLIGPNPMTTCNDCKMSYNKTDAKDIADHKKHHKKHHRKVAFLGPAPPLVSQGPGVWKKEFATLSGQQVIFSVDCYARDDWKRYAMKAAKFTEEAIGDVQISLDDLVEFQHPKFGLMSRYKIYVHTVNNKVIAVIIAMAITQGAPYYHEQLKYIAERRDTTRTDWGQDYAIIDGIREAHVCIDRIWVDFDSQRSGQATYLLNEVRQNFLEKPIKKSMIAISPPTENGRFLFTRYFTDAFYDFFDNGKGKDKEKTYFLVNPSDVGAYMLNGEPYEGKYGD